MGQCGNQIGSAFWPLVLHEYGIQTTSGGVNLLKTYKNYSKNNKELCDAFNSFFYVPDKKSECKFNSISDLESARVRARVCKFFYIDYFFRVLCKDHQLFKTPL